MNLHTSGSNPVRIYNNTATENGGGIFVQDQYCENLGEEDTGPDCFYHTNSEKKTLIIRENTAKQGPVLYGGLLNRCVGVIAKVGRTGITGIKEILDY